MPAARLLALSAVVPYAVATVADQEEVAVANPIRKVVTMLQAMQKKVAEEGERDKELHEKYMCYCKNSGGTLGASIAAAEAKVPAVGQDIKEAEALKVQTDEDLKQAQADRVSAKSAMAEATALREKEAAAFAKEKATYDANIKAVLAATVAIEKGMGGAFLQTGIAQTLKKLVLNRQDMLDSDRQELLAFLSGSQGAEYVPASGEIVGILKQLGDEMKKDLSETTETENTAIQSFESLMAAKKKEVLALTASIESKMQKSGDLALKIVQMKNDLSDTEAALLADKEFLANLDKDCDTKAADYDQIVKTRAEELVALAEVIKVLNDDDALELFKKTLPSAASSSLLQTKSGVAGSRARALAILKQALPAARENRAQIDLIALALHGEKIGFDKVIGMIDKMVKTLKKEQADDDSKKEYCGVQLDQADDTKKDLEHNIAGKEAAIATATDGIANLKDEIASLEAGIKDLDKSVAEATEQRKKEHAAHLELMSSNSAAQQLLNFAKNRLHKFYNPKLYRAPPKRELSAEERIAVNNGGTATPTPAPGGIAGTGIAVLAEVSVHAHNKDAPPPPPEAVSAYKKKSEETSGVVAMIDLLIKDLDKETAESATEERDSQADYEEMMSDSSAKRAADSKSLTEKNIAKASMESELQATSEAKAAAEKELMATHEYISSLHAECDWLLKYYDMRAEARSSEIDALGRAKAVLKGADFSLLQANSNAKGFLARVPT